MKAVRSKRGDVIALPLSFNRKLVIDLAERFLAIKPGPKRIDVFRKRHLHPIIAERTGFGIPPEAVRLDITKLETAIARHIESVIDTAGREGQSA